jgi:hypothetical protein
MLRQITKLIDSSSQAITGFSFLSIGKNPIATCATMKGQRKNSAIPPNPRFGSTCALKGVMPGRSVAASVAMPIIANNSLKTINALIVF